MRHSGRISQNQLLLITGDEPDRQKQLFPEGPFFAFRQLSLPNFQVQSKEYFVQVRQVPDEPSQRAREPFNESGHRHNLLVSGQIRLLANVDDFQVIPTIQVLLTNLFDILYSQIRFQRGSVDV
jgi:hypothetical protein